MGYEMGLARAKNEEDYIDLDSVEWFSCGWTLTELTSALLAVTDTSFEDGFSGDVLIELDKLSFIEDIAATRKSQHIEQILDALADIDYEYADELRESFPPVVKAAMRLSYKPPEGATYEQKQVCSELARLADEGYQYVTVGIAEAIERMKADGLTQCLLFAG